MRHIWTGVLAVTAGAALVVTAAGAALSQEESPSPEASMAAEASPAAEMVEPSTLSIDQVAHDRMAREPLGGKKYKKAIAGAAPNAVRYLIESAGDDTVAKVIGLSLAAREADEAGDAKAAKAMIDIATLLYRDEWTKTKSDPLTLNAVLQEAIDAAYPEGDPALWLSRLGDDGLMDVCLSKEGPWIYNPQTPSLCEDENVNQARVDYSLIDETKNGQPGLYTGDLKKADIGGTGIHEVVQSKTANDKLKGKKFKKAYKKTLKKAAPEVARYRAGGSGSGAMQGVIDLVLLARAADEAGDAKAAKAFMALALAAYRSGVPEPDATTEHNMAITDFIDANYAGVPGLQFFPPDGMIDVCLKSNGKPMWEGGGGIDQNTPWECEIRDGTVSRVSLEEVPSE